VGMWRTAAGTKAVKGRAIIFGMVLSRQRCSGRDLLVMNYIRNIMAGDSV
jgi:hypothetical protein